MLSSLVNASMVLGSIDDRLMECGVSRRSFLKFCSALMVAAPFGLAITDKLTPEAVAEEQFAPIKQMISFSLVHSPSKVVTLRTRVGGNRVPDMLSGEQLPRIC